MTIKKNENQTLEKKRSPNNRTLTVNPKEMETLLKETINLTKNSTVKDIQGKIIHQNLFEALKYLPDSFIDLLVVDPPYNLTKNYNGSQFNKMNEDNYITWLKKWIPQIKRCLKPNASLYVCCDWQSSYAIQTVLSENFIIRNRITWEREKGRGAKSNWKNCSEDIWFCTMSNEYTFNADSVKLKRKVLAPYKDKEGVAKDWNSEDGDKFRLTSASNLWNDISIPFWSMPENTDHPTQKPEKLVAKLILASSNPNDFVFDAFLGSGTTAVVAKKLGRNFSGVEMEDVYSCLGVKRLLKAEHDKSIQGYQDGFFWERNSLREQKKNKK